MASVNKVILIGHLGKDPEVRYAANGDAICNFSLATSEEWKDKSTGEKKSLVEWHRINAFGKLGEICGQYLKKGSQAYIEGSIRTRKWTDKEGIERYTSEIRVDSMRMLGSGPGNANTPASDSSSSQGSRNGLADDSYSPAPPKNKPKPSFDDLGDDIPF